MTNKLLAVFTVAAGLLMLSAPVFAHHGRSNYDVTPTITVPPARRLLPGIIPAGGLILVRDGSRC